jgi:hypothetical protein
MHTITAFVAFPQAGIHVRPIATSRRLAASERVSAVRIAKEYQTNFRGSARNKESLNEAS